MNTKQIDSMSDAESQIYFLSVRTNELLHQQALGFGKDVMLYAYANSPENAKRIAKGFVESKGLSVDKIEANPRPALNQALETYTFPEQIYGLPQDRFLALMDRRKGRWPEELIAQTIDEYQTKQAFISGVNLATTQENYAEEVSTTHSM